MGPTQAVKTGVSKLFDPSGRAPRSEFWWFVLFVFAAMTLTLGTVYAVLLMDTADFTADILVVLVTLVTVTATLRRLHDMLEAMLENKPDNAPYGFIAAYGGVVLLQTIFALITFILCLLPSKLGDNQHGPNPHEVPS